MPRSSLAFFYAGVFALFATVGFLTLMTRTSRLTWAEFALYVISCGGMAVLYAVVAFKRKFILIAFLAAGQTLALRYFDRIITRGPQLVSPDSRLPSQLQALSIGGSLMLAAGYTFFLLFVNREGLRYFGAHTEIALARELHQALVPAIQRTVGDYELYGASLPSGEVGGDLVDLVQRGEEWTAYVADVSGHGVSPGVLMAMFKATVRTQINAGCNGENLLAGVNETLYPLKTSNMFVTAGLLQARANQLRLCLAGHPAMLHLRRRTGDVSEYDSRDLPLGIFPQQSFSSEEIDCQPGDILLLLTDGITEVADKRGTELGSEPVKALLRERAESPLPEIFRAIRERSIQHGPQEDDQTMLLVRRSMHSN